MNLVRCAHNWNDGMVEYWNNGLAPFGQINANGGGLDNSLQEMLLFHYSCLDYAEWLFGDSLI